MAKTSLCSDIFVVIWRLFYFYEICAGEIAVNKTHGPCLC